jgi:hypothetical protein
MMDEHDDIPLADVDDDEDYDDDDDDSTYHDDDEDDDHDDASSNSSSSSSDDDEGNDGDGDNDDDVVGDNGVEPDGGEREQEITASEMDARYGARSGQYDLRPRRERTYNHLFTNVDGRDENDGSLATAQMGMKQGLRVFGQAGVEAVRKEMKQLHDRRVMQPIKSVELTPEQRREALGYLMFLKRKRCGTVKARGCADGRKQRAYIAKEDASSPTMSTEALLLTAVVDALEGRDVAVVDVPGAFMQADMDEDVHVRFTGTTVDLLLDIDPAMYGPYVVEERGERVMYVELLKALYGTLRAARLFWEKMRSQMIDHWGFTPNQYDPCVCNKMVNGKQLTVAWYVDDIKISHMDKEVVDNFIRQLEEEFGKEAPMNISRGKVHDYLGMILDFRTPGELRVDMVDYVKGILSEVPEDMRKGRASSPAANHLFNTRDDAAKITLEQADAYVRVVMQLLHVAQRARPDIRTAVSFLCTRLKSPDEDDYKKLYRVIRYLWETYDLVLRLKANGDGKIEWWVDASFAVHPDMKGHTGGVLSMGQGAIYCTSNKQKLVSRSSTESEVVGVHDVLPQILWTRHFLRDQGVPVDDVVLYQDNTSSMHLEKNGRSSSSKRTRHMNIRYFYITDQVSGKKLRIEHCPTGNMIADYFTKPLQGTLFKRMRDAIMFVDPSSKYHSGQRSVLSQKNGEEQDIEQPGDICGHDGINVLSDEVAQQ